MNPQARDSHAPTGSTGGHGPGTTATSGHGLGTAASGTSGGQGPGTPGAHGPNTASSSTTGTGAARTFAPSDNPQIRLSDGHFVPALGFGVYKVDGAKAERVVSDALAAGYRHIDTAALYENEEAVGRAVHSSGIDRCEITVTSKVWNDDHGYDATLRAFDASMQRLGLDTLDIYLIHWANPPAGRFVDTWKALIQLQRDGRVRSIGVSNFAEPELREIIDATGVVPALHQIELHPYFPQEAMVQVNESLGIPTEAWAPLSRGGALFEDPVLRDIAQRHDATPAQVVLAWHRQQGIITIPKSENADRMRENFASLGVSLAPEEVDAITDLDKGPAGRTGMDPTTMTKFGDD